MLKEETIAQLNMFVIFILANLLALVLMPAYFIYEGSLGENENNPLVAVYYALEIIALTAVILFFAKKKKVSVLKGIFYFAVAWSMWYALFPIFYYFQVPYSDLFSLALSILLTIYLLKNPEWYVMDIVGVLMAVGLSLIFGMALGLIPITLFLTILAIYDAISVYTTKHMVALADSVIQYNLPALFVIPAKENYSFKDVEGIKSEVVDGKRGENKKRERDAYYMGFGDVMIPGVMVVATARSFGIIGGLFTLMGAVVAMILLSVMVNSGKPQPGLPYLNAGCLGGFLLYLLLF